MSAPVANPITADDRRKLYNSARNNTFSKPHVEALTSDVTESTPLFLYGTLQCAYTLAQALNRPQSAAPDLAAKLTAATLVPEGCYYGEEWRTLAFRTANLPGLVRVAYLDDPHGPVTGLLLLETEDEDLGLLDTYEAWYQREKVVVKVDVSDEGQKAEMEIEAHTYVSKAAYNALLTARVWKLEDFFKSLEKKGACLIAGVPTVTSL